MNLVSFALRLAPSYALRGNPPSKSDFSFVMKDRYATVCFPTFELQKGGEPLLPTSRHAQHNPHAMLPEVLTVEDVHNLWDRA